MQRGKLQFVFREKRGTGGTQLSEFNIILGNKRYPHNFNSDWHGYKLVFNPY